jgi:hypothetical protein
MSIVTPPAEGGKTPPTPDYESHCPDVVVSEYEGLVRAFDLLRGRHQVDVMQPGLLACVCGERLPIVYGAEGQPLYNPIIRHHHEHYASAAAKRVAEFQWNALEMARKADLAERRAEDAEAEVEALRDVLAEVRRVFDLQCPPMLPDAYVDAGAWMAHSWWNTVLGHVLKRTDREVGDCRHEWLDRPESDTRECILCGTEVAG